MKHSLWIFGMILLNFIPTPKASGQDYIPASWDTESYFPLLKNYSRIAVTAHPASTVGTTHLVDTLIASGIRVVKIFAPEHGFRGQAEAGETIPDGRDPFTGLPVVSLYGKNKKPSPAQLEDIDCMVFDLQDVGVRFFTYLSTLHYIMESCAENNIPVIVLDRPNPNADYTEGPVLEKEFASFVGMHPIPLVYGMTLGEMAGMINGEGWLNNGIQCQLKVIRMKQYNRQAGVVLPVRPSPNLPNPTSIRLYPSLCLFAGTGISVGRGTDFPFQVIGYPHPDFGTFTFVPESRPGFAVTPLHQGQTCYGIDLRNDSLPPRFTLSFLLKFFHLSGRKESFFTQPAFFDKLAGNATLRTQILEGRTEVEIRESWKPALEHFRKKRKPYLLYPEE